MGKVKGVLASATASVLNKAARNNQFVLMPKTGTDPASVYAQDGLWSMHNHEFMEAYSKLSLKKYSPTAAR
jgi:hypothetical protein